MAIRITKDAVQSIDIQFYSQDSGSISGYFAGGDSPNSGSNVIDKYPFVSDGNATDVGNLTTGRYYVSSQSSDVSGYTSGGQHPPNQGRTIDKFPFATDGNATLVGNLTTAAFGTDAAAGQSSAEYGYASGGIRAPGYLSEIKKFPFAADVNATDVGSLTEPRGAPTGQSSITHGYTSGGFSPPAIPNPVEGKTIDKFPFAADANATDVGDLQATVAEATGHNSTEHGYSSGGRIPPNNPTDKIRKFSFASDGNSTLVGELTTNRRGGQGTSSREFGYSAGGGTPAPGGSNIINKFPFASDTNATDVGDLTITRGNRSGQGGSQI